MANPLNVGLKGALRSFGEESDGKDLDGLVFDE